MYDFPLPYTIVVFNTFFQTFRFMNVLTKSSIDFDRNHRSQWNFTTLFHNNVSYRAMNLNIFGCFVFEIFLKILLGALGIWLSIYVRINLSKLRLSSQPVIRWSVSSVHVYAFTEDTNSPSISLGLKGQRPYSHHILCRTRLSLYQ